LLVLDVVGYYLGDWGCVGGHHRSFVDAENIEISLRR